MICALEINPCVTRACRAADGNSILFLARDDLFDFILHTLPTKRLAWVSRRLGLHRDGHTSTTSPKGGTTRLYGLDADHEIIIFCICVTRSVRAAQNHSHQRRHTVNQYSRCYIMCMKTGIYSASSNSIPSRFLGNRSPLCI